MRTCEQCGARIYLDDEEVYRGVNRTLCIWCTERAEEARQDAADIMAEYRKAKGRE